MRLEKCFQEKLTRLKQVSADMEGVGQRREARQQQGPEMRAGPRAEAEQA